ncbi:MAG: flavodoxin family protein [Candidatus Zixiibacteriota bacterium]|nr:MAG: flavodoxin family protein [candidate division Zixibacteria bacterium]
MNITGISGSPTGGSSTDYLIRAIMDNIEGDHIKKRFVRLNEKSILPCQACGKNPSPDFCFLHDDMDSIFTLMGKSEGIILGSPIYFDSVSAQAKLFIDRTNCLRPVDFDNPAGPRLTEPLFRGKKGGIILVGGAEGKFQGALRTARAFFIWAGIDIVFELEYRTRSFNPGEAGRDENIRSEIKACADKLIAAIESR